MITIYEDEDKVKINGFDLQELEISGAPSEQLYDLIEYELKLDKSIRNNIIKDLVEHRKECGIKIQQITDSYKQLIIGEVEKYIKYGKEITDKIKKENS